MRIATVSQVREADRLTTQAYGIPSVELMERAGKGAAEILKARFPLRSTPFLVLAGPGNNGGDGRVVARYLKMAGYDVSVNAPILQWASRKGVIIDALFGIGLSRALEGSQAETIRHLNSLDRFRHFVISLDVPSGLDADTGQVKGMCVRADLTITFGVVKWGLLKEVAYEKVGDLEAVDIGYPREVYEKLKIKDVWVDQDFVRPWVKARGRSSHKGSHGHLLTLGGSAKKPGSIMLTGYAALRSGAGLVTVGLPEPAFRKFPKHFLELMFEPLPASKNGEFGKISRRGFLKILEGKTALAVGPGMGTSSGSRDFLRKVLHETRLPMVLDADALNLLAIDPQLLKRLSGRPIILTPHPGEMARLTGKKIKDRFGMARAFAKKCGVYLLLKGYRTVMATPEGKLYVNSTGNPAMATAGMGDTLTGIIGSLLAQGHETEQAMVLGCWLHGRAGDLAAQRLGDRGLVARDVAENLALIFKSLLSRARS